MKLKVTQTPWTARIAPKLASNFIELGYGLQVEGMMAEMFFNRSFEPFYAYRMINKLWYDLLEDENDHSSRCEDDWRVFDWYHSSYEHNAWFAFPGTAGHQPIRDDATFVIETSPMANVRIRQIAEGCHGDYAMEVVNEDAAEGGLAQDGKYCFADTGYTFRGKIRLARGSGQLRAALYREGTVTEPVAVAVLPSVGKTYTEVSAHLTVPVEGRYTFTLLIPPKTTVVCDDFSLMPDDRVDKWKKSAVEAGAYVAPHVIRWPGGCFASFYDWRDGVGPDRPPMKSYFWGGMQYNDIGTDELASYAEAVGAESMICVNMHHPYKRFYEFVHPDHRAAVDPDDPHLPPTVANASGRDLPSFADRDLGVREAAAWVEYCNGDETTEGGRARIAGGHPKPYNVKYWEMDNEVNRWFFGEEYARECVIYARAMKAVDPTIKIGMVSYGWTLSELESMLEIAGQDIDFFADRGFDEELLEKKLAILETYNKTHGRMVKYCNTEWLPLDGADMYNMAPRQGKITKCFMFSKWSYALDAASNLMMWQRHGDLIDFINFNNLANTHAQSAMETPKEGSFVTAAGEILRMFSTTRAVRPLQCQRDGAVYHPRRNDTLQVQVSLTEDGHAVVLNLLNRSVEVQELHLDLSAYPVRDEGHGMLLTGDELLSMNTLEKRGVRSEVAEIPVCQGKISMNVLPLSYAEYVIPMT